MSLASGTRLGPYEVVGPLGAGGMGEVYRARDTKLNRDVALKILPDAFAADPNRLARFTREAQTLAALNHPHIAHIHGLEESGGVRALVMELVEGEDLAQRIARGPIPLDEALPIAKQIAEALEAAHEQGIIHRDLKPSNVKVRPDGMVKVLDFGLAKALGDTATGVDQARGLTPIPMTPTITTPAMTAAGVILGTAAYMPPEQTRAAVIDKRADIWAFGVVLFEMLTGQRLFEGETVTDTLAAVLRQEIDWKRLPATTPWAAGRLLRRCLERDPKRRLRDIGEARIALETGGAETDVAPAAVAPQATPKRGRFGAMHVIAAALAVGLIAALAILLRPAAVREPVVARVAATLPPGVSVTAAAYPIVAISRDGSTIAVIGVQHGVSRLFVRQLQEFEARLLPDTDGASEPFFSPDGAWIGFFANGKLKKTPVGGGAVVALTSAPDVRGAVWTDADTIVFAPDRQTPLSEMPAAGGDLRAITSLAQQKHERTHRWPSLMPDGKTVLFNVGSVGHPDDYDNATIEAVRIDTGERRLLMQGGRMPRFVGSGDLVYVRGKILYAVGFDASRLEVRGRPRLIVDGVLGDLTTGAADYAVSDTGTLAYVPGDPYGALRRVVLVGVGGQAITLDLAPALYTDLHPSPDGRKVAFCIIDPASSNKDVWVADPARGTSRRLTFQGTNRTPVWSRDGRRIFYVAYDGAANRSLIMVRAADGSAAASQIGTLEGQAFLNDVTPDGKTLLMQATVLTAAAAARNRTAIYRLSTDAAKTDEPALLISSADNAMEAAVAPNGRWLAYTSTESARPEIFVQALTPGGGRNPVSTNGGQEPHWSPDGRSIYFRANNELLAVPIDPSTGGAMGKPTKLFGEMPSFIIESGQTYNVTSDGRVIMMRATDEHRAAEVRMTLNWFTDLRRAVPR